MSRLNRIAASGALALVLGPAQSFAQATCGRECLGTMLETYLEAVVENDPPPQRIVPE